MAGWRRAALNTEQAAELDAQIAEGKKTRAHPPASAHAAVARRAQDGWADRADAGFVYAAQRPSARASWSLFIDERPLMLRRRASE
jgi:hypothetical protein